MKVTIKEFRVFKSTRHARLFYACVDGKWVMSPVPGLMSGSITMQDYSGLVGSGLCTWPSKDKEDYKLIKVSLSIEE